MVTYKEWNHTRLLMSYAVDTNKTQEETKTKEIEARNNEGNAREKPEERPMERRKSVKIRYQTTCKEVLKLTFSSGLNVYYIYK